MDCDKNDHSDNESEWVTPFEVAMAFPEVAFAVVYSRNNMKQKAVNLPAQDFIYIFQYRLLMTQRSTQS